VLERDTGKTKAPPTIARNTTGLLLGANLHAGQSIPVRLTTEQCVRHSHVIGASGTGKSTLLFNLIKQDIENGEGVAVLDPHELPQLEAEVDFLKTNCPPMMSSTKQARSMTAGPNCRQKTSERSSNASSKGS
jgi:predicted ABC-type transport system involved in lysophospholipase L1 biosynthesis ATPase subunit